ncbi:hypothetical protein [Baekduia sp. Peel2402]|uniref:hypothetical protein n=1 Tax=Baekduia sp. Peel2402 TaxID=3458296 RepID=UPI00403E56D4
MERSSKDAVAAVTAFLHHSDVPFRDVADGEWGLMVDGCEIGLRLHSGFLRAQCWAAPAGVHDAHALLHANRLGELARYAHSAAGDVHVHAEIPEAAVGDRAALDRLLGAVVEARARLGA